MTVPGVLDQASGDGWTLFNGDCCEVLKGIPDRSVHLVCTSPPFVNVYTYSPSEHDMGNVSGPEEFFQHLSYLTAELRRVMIPGRIVAAHVYEIQRYANDAGVRSRYDFPGDLIRHMESFGFAFVCRITIDKDPQAAAIRNHPQELLFATLRRDASKSAPAQADYVLVFRAPGENPSPVTHPIDENTWIRWARPVWADVRSTDVLPDAGSRDDDDERHLAPLQLSVIERCVKLWTNPGETVLDPFAGIGSVPVVALRSGRRALGVELKPSYFRVARRFLEQEQMQGQLGLFAEVAS